MGKIKAVLFDFDGVIADCWNLDLIIHRLYNLLKREFSSLNENFFNTIKKVFNDALRRVLEKHIEENFYELVSMALNEIGLNVSCSEIMKIASVDKLFNYCKINNETKELIKKIVKENLNLGLISNAPVNYHEYVLRREGILKIYISCDKKY